MSSPMLSKGSNGVNPRKASSNQHRKVTSIDTGIGTAVPNPQGSPGDTKRKLPVEIPPEVNTLLVILVEFLRSHHPDLFRRDDLAIRAEVESLIDDETLWDFLKESEKTIFDEKTNLIRFRPQYDLKSKDDILKEVKLWHTRGGMPVNTIKKSWPGCMPAIEELEASHLVLVTRTETVNDKSGESGQPKAVFVDRIGKVSKVDDEFKKIWHTLHTPDETLMMTEMKNEGINLAESTPVPLASMSKAKPKGKRKMMNRKVKITNSHIKDINIDLSKDYVKPSKP